MLADFKIPIRMADPFQVQLLLKAKIKVQIVPAEQLVENDPIVNSLDRRFDSIAIIKQGPTALFYSGNANRPDPEHTLGRRKIDSGLLFFRLDFKQDDIFRVGIGDNRPAKKSGIFVVLDSSKGGSPTPRDRGKCFADTTEQEELKSKQTGKRLQLDQARHKPSVLLANSKINDQAI